MTDWVDKLLRGRYVALLEAEVMRLRAENRALMNSLLGTAGFPPVEFPETSASGGAGKPHPLPRLRKRSWHQIQAWRETDAAREALLNIDERANGPIPHS